MHLPHTKETGTGRSPGRGPSPGVPANVRAAIAKAIFEEWADEADEELAVHHAACLARLLARKARNGLRAVRVTLSREELYRGDFHRARRRAVDERPANAAVCSDFYLPAAALLDRMLRDGVARGVTA